MEAFLLLVLIILVVIFWVTTAEKISRSERKINELGNRLRDIYLNQLNQTIDKKPAQPAEKPAPVVPQAPPRPMSEVKPPVTPVTPVVPVIQPKPVEQPKIAEEKKEQIPSDIPAQFYQPASQVKPVTPPKPPKPPKPTFWERNPDLEKFIGENLINKIGIAVLVLGIGFFVKYAIDQDWINQIGRVAIGIFCGGILLGVAHYLRKRFKAFSSVLVGGGIAVLYFTIAIAFH